MANEKPGPISEWIRIEITSEGYWIRVMPGARSFSLPEVIAHLLALAVPGIDFHAVKAAYDAQSGARQPISGIRHAEAVSAATRTGSGTPLPSATPVPVRTAPPQVAAPPPPPTGLRVDQRGTEIYLTVPPDAPSPSLRDALAQLANVDASRLDIALVRVALGAERGVAHRVSRKLQRETSKRLRKLRPGKPAEGVLLACGEDHLRERIAETLAQRGLVVYPAGTAAAATSETLQRMPDVLVLTHPIGTDDGLEFVRQVRKHPRTQRTPVIVIPSNPSREVVEEAIRAGANDFLVRPVTPGALLKKVGKALETIGKSLPAQKSPGTDPEAAAAASEEELRTAGKIDLVKLARRVDKLLALPAVVQRVMSITADARSGAKELGIAIQADPAVTATVLRKANSAYFGKKERISEIQEALVRLGFIQTRSLVVGMSMIHLFAKGQRSVGFNRVEFWRHSMTTAIVAKLLADRAAYPAPDLAFIAGLLHDVGKIILDEYYGPEFEQAALLALKDLIPMRVAERQVLETDHAEIGWAILELWKFPTAITTAVGRHHDLPRPEEKMDAQQKKLCRVIHVANLLAKALGEGNGGDQVMHEVPKEIWESLELWDGLPADFWKLFQDELARTQDFLDLGDTKSPAPAAGEGRKAVLLETTSSVASLLGVALDRSGWKLILARTPDQAARYGPKEADAIVVRSLTAQELVDACSAIRATSRLPIVGVLPEGQPRLERVEGFDCLVEPYDRLALLHLLPG
ncbi:MAG: response regulator [Planctomycetota bacterium]